MVLWSTWHPYVLPETPNVPGPLLDHIIRQSAINFLEESQVWTADVDVIDVVAGTGTYSLIPPASVGTEGDVAMAKWVWVNKQQIFPASQEELGQLSQYWADVTAGAVSNFTQLTQDTITLYPIPDFSLTSGLRIKVALRPSLTSTGVPDWIGGKYVQEIAVAAKALLMGMVGKEWSDPSGEEKYSQQYASMLTKATVEGIRSFTRTTTTVRFPRYG